MKLDKSISDRLAFYGFFAFAMKGNDPFSVNDLIVAYTKETSERRANQLLANLCLYANKYDVCLAVSKLANIRRTITMRITAPKNKPVTAVKKPDVINQVKKPEVKNPTIYKARGNTELMNKEKPILCTCPDCGLIANDIVSLKYNFGVSLQDRRFRMKCLDCE